MLGRTRLTLLTIGAAALTVAAGCGVPSSSDFAPVDSDEIPFGLAETSTTSTTTTLAPTTTVLVIESTTTLAPTSSTISTEPVNIVYIAGSQLTRIPTPVAGEASLPQVIAAMKVLPSGDLAAGLRAVIPEDADIEVSEDGGVATVDLPEDFFDTITVPTDQRLVIGQIVLTLVGRPGIGQVEFLLDGDPLAVFLGNGESARPGQNVSREDYEILLSGVPETTTTTSTTTTTTTTTSTTTTVPSSTPETAAP